MPRIHLNLFWDVDTPDEEDTEFVDLAEAKLMAVASVRELVAGQVIAGLPINYRHRIEITDAANKLLPVIPFGETITIIDGQADDR